eukprot:1373373-Amorphochlora_amoeboformis.AAC.1
MKREVERGEEKGKFRESSRERVKSISTHKEKKNSFRTKAELKAKGTVSISQCCVTGGVTCARVRSIRVAVS